MSTTTENLGLTKVVQTDTMATWMTAHNENAEKLDGILGLVYPVGSIYMSANNTSPATLFGGTWEAIGGKFLIGADSGHSAGSTGGSETKTIAETNLPSHSHSLNSHTHSIGAHSHGLNNHTHSIGAHSHGLNSHVHSVGAHSHGLNSHTHTGPSHTHTYTKFKAHTHTLASGYAAIGDSSSVVHANLVGTEASYNVQLQATLTGATAVVRTVSKTGTMGNVVKLGGTTDSTDSTETATSGASGTGSTGAATGNTANSTAFNTGAASGSTANSTAFDSGAASGNTANSAAFNSGAASGNTGAAGGGTALNIMPPYLSVYMWKRTA